MFQQIHDIEHPTTNHLFKNGMFFDMAFDRSKYKIVKILLNDTLIHKNMYLVRAAEINDQDMFAILNIDS
jgi:hypothetical protein